MQFANTTILCFSALLLIGFIIFPINRWSYNSSDSKIHKTLSVVFMLRKPWILNWKFVLWYGILCVHKKVRKGVRTQFKVQRQVRYKSFHFDVRIITTNTSSCQHIFSRIIWDIEYIWDFCILHTNIILYKSLKLCNSFLLKFRPRSLA